jgi:hypothetical protein
MSNVIKFHIPTASPARVRLDNPATDAELRLLSDCKTGTDILRDLRDILLFLELAATHLRRTAMNSDPGAKDSSEEYLTQAEKLIEIARRKAAKL